MTTLRYWAAARAAAGTAQEEVAGGTLGAALDRARAAHGDRFARVLSVCAVLVDGEPLGARDPSAVALDGVAVVDVLPPFAGG